MKVLTVLNRSGSELEPYKACKHLSNRWQILFIQFSNCFGQPELLFTACLCFIPFHNQLPHHNVHDANRNDGKNLQKWANRESTLIRAKRSDDPVARVKCCRRPFLHHLCSVCPVTYSSRVDELPSGKPEFRATSTDKPDVCVLTKRDTLTTKRTLSVSIGSQKHTKPTLTLTIRWNTALLDPTVKGGEWKVGLECTPSLSSWKAPSLFCLLLWDFCTWGAGSPSICYTFHKLSTRLSQRTQWTHTFTAY